MDNSFLNSKPMNHPIACSNCEEALIALSQLVITVRPLAQRTDNAGWGTANALTFNTKPTR